MTTDTISSTLSDVCPPLDRLDSAATWLGVDLTILTIGTPSMAETVYDPRCRSGRPPRCLASNQCARKPRSWGELPIAARGACADESDRRSRPSRCPVGSQAD